MILCLAHEIYREETVGLRKIQLYLKNYNFCENVKSGAISLKLIFVNNSLINV